MLPHKNIVENSHLLNLCLFVIFLFTGGFVGFNHEMRELAAVISRDIYLHDPNVKWSDIVGLDHAKGLVKEAVVYPIKVSFQLLGLTFLESMLSVW